MAFLRAAIFLICLPLTTWAGPAHDRLLETVRIDDQLAVISAEGLAGAQDIDETLLEGAGGGVWTEQVQQLYAPERLKPMIREKMIEVLDEDPALAVASFFQSDEGQRIIEVELSGRQAFLDPELEEAARDLAVGHEKSELVMRFLEANNLVDLNVDAGLNSDLRFLQGLSQGGALDMDETEMLESVWSEEPAMRIEVSGWLTAYYTLVFSALSDVEIETYIAFSETKSGRAYNRAVFEAFNHVFEEVAFGLGQSAALFITDNEI